MPPADSDTLILEHCGLARRLARRYQRPGESSEDLEQAAYLGLVKAARRFDHTRGTSFTSFAVPTVLGELRRFCRDTRWSVHVPRAVQERVQTLRRFEDASEGRAPSVAEAASGLGWSPAEVLDARAAIGCLRSQSLNTPLVGDDGTIGEAIDAVGEEDSGFAAAETRDELERAFAMLTERERRVLRLRGDGLSTAQIAHRVGLSTPQAARLVSRAVRRLRGALDGEPTVAVAPKPRIVRLADADPDLFAGVDAAPVAPRVVVEPGHWSGPDGDRGLGLLVLSGALLRRVHRDGKPRAELIGPGDMLLRDDGQRGADWQVIGPKWPSTHDDRPRAHPRDDRMARRYPATERDHGPAPP